MKIIQLQNFSINDGEGIRTTIFMMGCPLRCKWCSNPETWTTQIKHAKYQRTRYICRECNWTQDSGIVKRCPKCTNLVNKEDYYEIKSLGQEVTIEDVISKIKRQLIFYRFSNGGVTFSGGEPTYQEEELRELVNKLFDLGINMSIETCGYFDFEQVRDILSKLNHIFVDIKHMNDEKHFHYTGVSNKIILGNIIKLKQLNIPITIRVPSIIDVNFTKENLEELLDFLKDNFKAYPLNIEFLPYHNFGKEKYNALEMEEYYHEYQCPNNNEFLEIKSHFEYNGIKTIKY